MNANARCPQGSPHGEGSITAARGTRGRHCCALSVAAANRAENSQEISPFLVSITHGESRCSEALPGGHWGQERSRQCATTASRRIQCAAKGSDVSCTPSLFQEILAELTPRAVPRLSARNRQRAVGLRLGCGSDQHDQRKRRGFYLWRATKHATVGTKDAQKNAARHNVDPDWLTLTQEPHTGCGQAAHRPNKQQWPQSIYGR